MSEDKRSLKKQPEFIELIEPRGRDYDLARRVMVEQFALFYPLIPWEMIDYIPESPSSPDAPIDEQRGIGMNFDPIWGESVPEDIGDTWENPHSRLAEPPPDDPVVILPTGRETERFLPPVEVPVYVLPENTYYEVKNPPAVFDEDRDLACILLIPACVDRGVTPRVGDRLEWDDSLYTVTNISRTNYWKNSNVPLYLAASCKRYREGT